MSITEIPHWINGAEDPGTGTGRQEVFNPATGEVTGNLHLANAQDLARTVSAAEEAAALWGGTSLSKRMQVLFAFRELVHTHTEDLARIITAEHGKVLSDAIGEVRRGLEVVEFACALPQTLKGEYSEQAATGIDVYTFRQPLGVVAGITPFNFPVMVPLWMAPVAIATGNAFILKPSERDPSASLLLARLWKQAGLPKGVFQVLQGDKDTVQGLLTHELVDGVSFVGSTPIAQYIQETAIGHGKRVQALGGAKNHAVVLADADLNLVADHLSAAAFGSAGERCMAISVAVVVDDIADELIPLLRQRAKDIITGEGTDADVEMGPLITEAARDRAQRIITEAEAAGATVLEDGRDLVVEGHESGFFLGPTVIDHVTPQMSAYQEEIFGPVLVIRRAADLEEAISIINANPYGNGTAIFTSSGYSARTFKRKVQVGMIGINVPIPVPAAQHSFGGWKASLFGDHHIYGPEGVNFYTRAKAITERWPQQNEASRASLNFPSHD